MTISGRNLSVVGAAFMHGQKKSGVQDAHDHIMSNGFPTELQQVGNTITDDSIVYPNEKIDSRLEMSGEYFDRLARKVHQERTKGNRVICIGGDHSIAVGSINGVLQHDKNTIVVWVDAHADINTTKTSPSMNLHGMPLAFLTGLEDTSLLIESDMLRPKLKLDQFALIGIRDVDDGEKLILKKHGINAYWMEDVKRMGIEGCVKDLLKKMDPEGKKKIHLSFDIDGIDEKYVPATGTPVGDGLRPEEGFKICDMLAETGRLESVDLVEVNMALEMDKTHNTLDIAREILVRSMKSY